MMIKGKMNKTTANNNGYDTQRKDEYSSSKQRWI